MAAQPELSVDIVGARAGMNSECIREAWKASLPLRPVRRKRVIALSGLENTHNHVKNSRGDTIRIDLPPVIACGEEASFSEYGVSLAMRLYLIFVREGALCFFLMFLLSVATINDSVHRSALRGCCREAASTSYGYDVIVNGRNSSEHAADAEFEDRCGSYADLSSRCGYRSLNIRSFNPKSLSSAYASSGDPYMLWTALGACEEYANVTLGGGREYVVADLATHNWPFLVATPDAHFCLRPFESVYWSVWMQFLCIVVFILFLVRLRILSTRVALQHDQEHLTTADFSLMFSGLEKTVTADELRESLHSELATLGFDRSKIAYIEVGRHCEDELSLIARIAALDTEAEELEARRRALSDAGRPFEVELGKLRGLVTEYTGAKNRIKELMVKPDIATGHAFVVFQLEAHRNACANLFHREAPSFYEYLLREAKLGGTPAAKHPLTELKCVCRDPPETSWYELIVYPERWLFHPRVVLGALGLVKPAAMRSSPGRVVVTAAPEPDEVLWTNLEVSERVLAKHQLWAYLATLGMVLVTLALVLSLKLYAADITADLNLSLRRAGDGMALLARGATLGVTALVATVTVVINIVIRIVITAITKKGGIDTRTEEERVLFGQVSIAFVLNSVAVPLFAGAFLSLWSVGAVIDQSWYEPGGVLAQALGLIIGNYVNDMLKAANVYVLLMRYYYARYAYSQSYLNKLWRPITLHVGVQYSFALKTAAMGVIYGPLYPPAYMLTALGLGFSWVASRIALRYYYKRPESVNQEMMLEMCRRLGQTLGLSLIFQIVAVNRAITRRTWAEEDGNEYVEYEWGTVGILYLGGPLLLLVYWIFPYSCFRSCANVDELTNFESGGVETLESGGISHDQVTSKLGLDLERYECPLTRVRSAGEGYRPISSSRRASTSLEEVAERIEGTIERIESGERLKELSSWLSMTNMIQPINSEERA